jgi:transitional endoplasmic reticulum ATPase
LSSSDPVASLREALRLSPDNLPLRRLLAETLLQHGRADEAEAEYRDALVRQPDNVELKMGLARAFQEQRKSTAALTLLEELIKSPAAPGEAFVMCAKLLSSRGEIPDAIAKYKLGLERDPDAADKEFEEQLGIGEEYEEESEISEGKLHAGWEEESALPEMERPKLTFADVGGMETLKEEIQIKIVHPLNHPELFAAYGKKIGGGILMYGPPGCGKTHLARATAGEIKANFLAVGIADVLDMWIGASERNMRQLFEKARESKPCVLFFDEVDALGARRSDMLKNAGRHLINQFLSEMDGVGSNNDGVLILAATNSPWHLDPAFRRPGRFDRILFVPPPDATARAAILRVHLKDKPTSNIDYAQVAKKTDQFSGADLKAVVDLAVEAKLREALKAGAPKPIATADLLAAAAKLRPTTKEWFATARNHALYANEGGIYDDILKYLKIQ